MDWLIELIASGNNISQMATRTTLIDPHTIASPIRDIQVIGRCKNYCSDFQQPIPHKFRRWNERSGRKIPFFGIEAFGKRHRHTWRPSFAAGSMVSCDKTRILTRNVEIAIRIKCQVKRVIDSGVPVSVSFYEGLDKIVLAIFIDRAPELQDFAVFEIRVDHIEILIRSE